MDKALNYSKKEVLFFISYFLLGFANVVAINSYLFGENSAEVYVYVLYISAIFAALSFCFENYKTKEIALIIIVIAIGFLITAHLHLISFGVTVLLIVTALNIDAKKIIKISVLNNIFFMAIVVLPALIGIIPNEIYDHNGVNAYCFGFQYYSSLPNLVFSITIFTYLLADTKIKRRIVLLFSLPIQLIVYKYCTVRLILYLYFIFLVLAVIAEFYDIRKEHKIISKISTIMYPVMSIMTFIISFIYSRSNILIKINEILNYRFGFNELGFSRYGITILGNKIITDAGTIDANNINHYFYIDSGYVYALLSYGIIFFVLIMVMYSILSKNAAKNNQSRLLIICAIICIYSVINNLIFDITLNPLPLLAFQVIMNNRQAQRGLEENKNNFYMTKFIFK